RTPEENYGKTRGLVASRFGSGEPDAGFLEDGQVAVLQSWARKLLGPERFAAAERYFENLGDPVRRWSRALTGTERMPIPYGRISPGGRPLYRKGYTVCGENGCSQVELRAVAWWPPDDGVPPGTADPLEALRDLGEPLGQPDDGGLAKLVDPGIA